MSSPLRPPSREEAEAAVRTLIRWAGDDPDREGLVETPRRVAHVYEQLFEGYRQDAAHILARVFEEAGGYDDLVLVRDIPFFSHCEHHMVPFFGKAHIGYYSSSGIVGLSKLAHVVDMFSHRLQTQETMSAEIVQAIEANLKPRGIALMIEAQHLCMSMRGVRKPGAKTVTSAVRGSIRDNASTRAEAMSLLLQHRT